MIRRLILLLTVVAANGTSVFPELHECPVCGLKSVKMSMGSYSQFGEPARDLADEPRFAFPEVNVCPGDLYASWSMDWGGISPGEKAKLAGFLKEPSLHLTAEEKDIIAGHEDVFRKSPWFRPLWARTCDELRDLKPRARFQRELLLHFAGKYRGEQEDAEDWEKRLGSLYRENAISALKDAVAADWTEAGEKRTFAYLRAELIRQAGRDGEAHSLFQQVIVAEKAAEPDEKLAWISRWAEEQGIRCGPAAGDPAALLQMILPELPDPWRKRDAAADPRWPRHYAAADVLSRKAAGGAKPFSDALWKLLDRKPERLLALLETIAADIAPLRSVDARWRGWFEELETSIRDRKLPGALAKDPNQTRVINVLRAAVGSDEAAGKAWRNDVLLPAVRKAVAAGGMPAMEMPVNDRFPMLPPMDGDDEPSKPQLKEIDRELYELWKEQPPDGRTDVARIYIRLLRGLDETWESTQYPVMYFLPEIAETEDGREAIARELEGEWESSFWKAACAYAARVPDSGEAFLGHPFLPKADDSLVVKLLAARSDASWMDGAIKKLEGEEWVSSEVIEYLASLARPEASQALHGVAERIRMTAKPTEGGCQPDGRLSTLRQIEGHVLESRLAELLQ